MQYIVKKYSYCKRETLVWVLLLFELQNAGTQTTVKLISIINYDCEK